MPEPSAAPIGGLFALGKLLEEEDRAQREATALRKLFGVAEPEMVMVTFLTEYEPPPAPEPEVSSKYALMARLLMAGPGDLPSRLGGEALSGEGFSADAGALGDGAGDGAGASEAYAGYSGSGDRLPSPSGSAGASRARPNGGEQQPAPGQHDRPPQSRAREYHERWSAIPEQLRPYIHQRESEAAKRISELGGPAKAHGDIASVFQRHGVALPEGATHAQTVDTLLAAQRALVADPGKFIRAIAQHANVDLRALAGVGDQTGHLQAAEGRAQQAEIIARQLMQENAALKRAQAEGLERQKAGEARRKAENALMVAEAKRHQVLNLTSGRGGTPAKGTIRDSLERHASRLMGR